MVYHKVCVCVCVYVCVCVCMCVVVVKVTYSCSESGLSSCTDLMLKYHRLDLGPKSSLVSIAPVLSAVDEYPLWPPLPLFI